MGAKCARGRSGAGRRAAAQVRGPQARGWRSSTISAPAPPSAPRACCEGDHFSFCTSQLRTLPLEHRQLVGRAVALAVDHAHAAHAAPYRAAQELGQRLARLFAAQAVQVELVLRHPFAAPQLLDHVHADTGAAEGEALIGVQQALDVEFVGQRGRQRFLVVAQCLHRQRRGLARGGLDPVAVAQRADLTHRTAEHVRFLACALRGPFGRRAFGFAAFGLVLSRSRSLPRSAGRGGMGRCRVWRRASWLSPWGRRHFIRKSGRGRG